MKEKNLRQAHRYIGIPFAIFVILQSATGIVLSIEDMFGTYYDTIIRDIHHRFGFAGNIFRIILGVSILWMAITGLLIYSKIRARIKQ